jgi:hypothetical protein
VGREVTTPTTPNPLRGFTVREAVEELVRRVGPDETCRLVGHIATIDEMLALADEYDKLGPTSSQSASNGPTLLSSGAAHFRRRREKPTNGVGAYSNKAQ